MKHKIILFAAGAVLLAASAFTFASVNKSNDPMDDLFKANVEALSRSEVGGLGEICAQSPKPGKYRMKYCSTCGRHGYYTRDYIAFCQN